MVVLSARIEMAEPEETVSQEEASMLPVKREEELSPVVVHRLVVLKKSPLFTRALSLQL